MKDKRKTPQAGQKSRRRFTKTLAAALVTAPVAAASAVRAQTTPAAREPKAPPNPQTTPTPAAAGPTPPQTTPAPKPSPVAEAYAGVARALYGEQLSEEEFARVKRDLEGNVRAAERLRASKLKNSDEPDSIFSA